MAEIPTDNIDAMIAYFESQIEAFQKGLSGLQAAKAALAGSDVTIPGMAKPATTPSAPVEIAPDAFTGMSIVEGSEAWLKMVGRPARSTEAIVEALKKGGLQRVTPASTATLLIRVHNNEGAIVRAQKGLWGLAGWYPRRPQKLRRTGTVPEGKTVEDVIEEVDEAKGT